MKSILAFLPDMEKLFSKQGIVATSSILAGISIGLFIEGQYEWMTAVLTLLVLSGLLYGRKKTASSKKKK